MAPDWVVLCTGPSMSQAVADSARDLPTIAVNQAFDLAPWAIALAANDAKWWAANPDALRFKGRKFSTARLHGVEQIESGRVRSSSCSGVLGLHVAQMLGAKRIILLGADLGGAHYFGDYPRPMVNADKARHRKHIEQFHHWDRSAKGVQVFNGTPGSALKCFPQMSLDEFRRRLAA